MIENEERDRLVRALDMARDHVLDQVSSISRADLYRSQVPSNWSPLGLIRHLTLSDERYWFEVVIHDYRRAIANSNRIVDVTRHSSQSPAAAQ